ncbi:hypothetical protein [Streptomyces cinereospinus]|uniref:Uncharacterized protein n=1 Tax=Streptomyces cinereospinus TaxID=285561 RepID=A0ABV5N2N6_9ACTN
MRKRLGTTLHQLLRPLGMTCPNGECGGTMVKSGDFYQCPKCGATM